MKRNFLFFVLALGFLLRVVWLDKFPHGFTPDEASFGYDAFSLLKTGEDQWGHAFPLVLESFGDFKPPLYAYILMPFVWLFGLSRWVVRLPNALIGSMAIYATYLLVSEFEEKKNEYLALVSAALLAISPWHIMMSRGAFEANLTTFLLPFGIYLFIRGLNKSKALAWSAVFLGLNLFSYHSAKLVTPLIVFILIGIYRAKLIKVNRKHLVLSALIFSLFLSLTFYTFTQRAGARAQDVSIYRGALEAQAQDRLDAIESGMSPFVARLFNNKYLVTLERFVENYKQYFSLKFLFIDGPAEGTYGMMPGRGVLYWYEALFIIGLMVQFIRRKLKRSNLFIITLLWIIIAPVSAALTTGRGYAANRAVIMLPAIYILLAIGANGLYLLLKEKIGKGSIKIALVFFGIVAGLSFIGFVRDYYINSPFVVADEMLYGNLQMSEWVKKNTSDESDVIVSRKLSEPHIYIAFSYKWDPKDYQENTKQWNYKEQGVNWVDQMPSYKLGNFIFENIDYEIHNRNEFTLIGRPDEFDETESIDKVFYYPDLNPAINVYLQAF